MAQVTKTYDILGSADDGYYMQTMGMEFPEESIQNTSTNMLTQAFGVEISSPYFRFRNIDIPQGKTIVSARLMLRTKSYGNVANGFDVRVSGEKTANSAVITSVSDYMGRNWTTANYTYSVVSLADNYSFSIPYLESIIQEIINQPSWVSGNALTLFVIVPDFGGTLSVASAENGSYAPQLEIIFEDSATDTTPPAEVTNIQFNTEIIPTYLYVSWTNPVDSDFAGVKFYRNGVYVETIDKPLHDYLITSGFEDTFKFTTIDTTGNESTGVTANYNPPVVSDGFYIERSTNNVNFTEISVQQLTATEFIDTTVVGGTTYYYRIKKKENGIESEYSDTKQLLYTNLVPSISAVTWSKNPSDTSEVVLLQVTVTEI